MRDLSLNILDITQNSVKAKASLIVIDIEAENGLLTIRITDNGSGMSGEFLKRCTDPFVTTRTTRKVGMGLSLLKMQAEDAGGDFNITSQLGKGTVVSASFRINHIDRSPLGDLAGTAVTLISGAPECDFILNYVVDGRKYIFETKELKEQLGNIDITQPEILLFLGEMIKENIEHINGGLKL